MINTKKIIFLILLAYNFNVFAPKTNNSEPIKNILELKENRKKTKPCNKKIEFNYKEEDLSKIINQLASLKNINVILPQPPIKFSAKFTFYKEDKITVDEAWTILITALDIAGFSIIKKDDIYQIVQNTAVNKDAGLPIYINSDIKSLPDSDLRIRYLYYFKNITLQTGSAAFTNLDNILKGMIKEYDEDPRAGYTLDPVYNTLMITSKSSSVKNGMSIIQELDQIGFREAMIILPLNQAKPTTAAEIINKLISAEEELPYRYFKPQKPGGFLFSESTKVIPIESIGSLAILGPSDSVERVKDFVQKYIDLPLEAIKSVIHIRPIEYIDADELAGILQKFVQSKSIGAQSEVADKDGFSSIIIKSDKEIAASVAPTTLQVDSGTATAVAAAATPQRPQVSGNNLIIAARSDHWQMLNKIIDQIDKPQLQVMIESIFVEMTIDDLRQISSQARTHVSVDGGPKTFNFQSAQLAPPVLNYTNPPTNTNINIERGVSSDLLGTLITPPGSTTPQNIVTSQNLTPGGIAFTFTDGNGIAYVLTLLEQYTDLTVVSKPFVIAKNNTQAIIIQSDLRNVEGPVDLQNSSAGAVVRQNVLIPADRKVNVLPRISNADVINLEINISSNTFLPNNGGLQNVRQTNVIATNTNVRNKEVLVLGGLITNQKNHSYTEWPILARIPIIGNLFKSKSKEVNKRYLVVFMSPTLIAPRIEGGLSRKTKSLINDMKEDIINQEKAILGSNFVDLRDPITRIVFEHKVQEFFNDVDTYQSQTVFKDQGRPDRGISYKKKIRTTDGYIKDIEGYTTNKIARTTADALKAETTVLGPDFVDLRDPVSRAVFDHKPYEVTKEIEDFHDKVEFQKNPDSELIEEKRVNLKDIVKDQPNPLKIF